MKFLASRLRFDSTRIFLRSNFFSPPKPSGLENIALLTLSPSRSNAIDAFPTFFSSDAEVTSKLLQINESSNRSESVTTKKYVTTVLLLVWSNLFSSGFQYYRQKVTIVFHTEVQKMI